MVRAIFGFMALLGLVAAAPAQAGPAEDSLYGTPAEARWAPLYADLPRCDDASVLSTIVGRFGETENTYWGGKHAIGGFERVREIGFRSNGLSYIPRRYCVARAVISNEPKPRTAIYAVTATLGIIGWTWGIEWCVVGLDREHAYAPDCEVLRPIIERWIGQYKWLGEYGLRARF